MHRAETILEAVKTALTGLTTTGTKVERGRVYPVEELPALSLEMGADNPNSESSNLAFQDRELDFVVTSYVKSSTNTETLSNAIRAEVYAALMGNRTLSLSYVMDVSFNGDDKPQLSGESELRTSSQAMNYTVRYRHSLINAES